MQRLFHWFIITHPLLFLIWRNLGKSMPNLSRDATLLSENFGNYTINKEKLPKLLTFVMLQNDTQEANFENILTSNFIKVRSENLILAYINDYKLQTHNYGKAAIINLWL